MRALLGCWMEFAPELRGRAIRGRTHRGHGAGQPELWLDRTKGRIEIWRSTCWSGASFDLLGEIVESPLQFPLQVTGHCHEYGAAAPTRTGDLLITNLALK